MKLSAREAINSTRELPEITIEGWVKTRRESKGLSFMEVNDGSCQKNLQVVIRDTMPNYEACISELQTGASVMVRGSLIESEGKNQKWELLAETVVLLGGVDNTYPLQKKGHTAEFLRENMHLRPRTNLMGAVLRVRSRLAYALHNFFQERGFYYVQTPIITTSDCEGAGEMFRVTTLHPKEPKLDEAGEVDYSNDFFGKKNLSYCQRTTTGRDNGLRDGQGLYLRPHLPR